MTKNDELADEVVGELLYAITALQTYRITAEQFLRKLQLIMKAANL